MQHTVRLAIVVASSVQWCSGVRVEALRLSEHQELRYRLTPSTHLQGSFLLFLGAIFKAPGIEIAFPRNHILFARLSCCDGVFGVRFVLGWAIKHHWHYNILNLHIIC